MVVAHAGGDAVLQLFEHDRGDAGHVELRASVIGSQTSSTSSASGPTKPSSRCATAGDVGGEEAAVETPRPLRRRDGAAR